MARAVYSRERFLILDDCFSGLDATTEDRIFSRLLGKSGLIRKEKMTTILVTHATHRLPYADQIIVLNENGRVAEQGSFEHLMHHGSYVPTVVGRHHQDLEAEKTEDTVVPMDTYRSHLEEVEIERAAAEMTRQVGDLSTYKYYFAACGWINTLVFFATVAGFGIFLKLPGEKTKSYSRLNLSNSMQIYG